MKRLDHIGIATRDLEQAKKTYQDLLGVPPSKEEIVEQAGVRVVFFEIGEMKIELLTPLSRETPLYRFLEKRGEGLHHIAFHVDQIDTTCRLVKERGFELVSDTPQRGAGGKRICFLRPEFTHKVLVELCEPQDKISTHV